MVDKMAYFNKNENEIVCKLKDMSFNFIKVPRNLTNFYDLIDNVEISIFNIENVNQNIKDNYSHNSVSIKVEDSLENLNPFFLKTNYVGLGPNGVFKGKVFCEEDSDLGKFIKSQYLKSNK